MHLAEEINVKRYIFKKKGISKRHFKILQITTVHDTFDHLYCNFDMLQLPKHQSDLILSVT